MTRFGHPLDFTARNCGVGATVRVMQSWGSLLSKQTGQPNPALNPHYTWRNAFIAWTSRRGCIAQLTWLPLLCWAFASPCCSAQSLVKPGNRQTTQTSIVSFDWQSVPLRDALDRLAATQRVAIWLDRRVDPEQTLSFHAQQKPIDEALAGVAAAHGWDTSRIGEVIYIGPPPTARLLRTIEFMQQQRLNKLAPSIRQSWLRVDRVAWPALSEPREMVVQWLGKAQLRASNLEAIPHDLWAEKSLGDLNLLQRVILVLAGFELAPEIDANGNLRIVPWPTQATLTQTYRLSNSQLRHIDDLSKKFGADQLRQSGRAIQLKGRLEDHEQLQAWLQRPNASEAEQKPTSSRPRTVDRSRQRYTLTVENQPREKIIAALAQQAQLTVDWQTASDAVRTARVSVSVQNATLGELLRAILRDDAEFRVEGNRLRISNATTRGDSR